MCCKHVNISNKNFVFADLEDKSSEIFKLFSSGNTYIECQVFSIVNIFNYGSRGRAKHTLQRYLIPGHTPDMVKSAVQEGEPNTYKDRSGVFSGREDMVPFVDHFRALNSASVVESSKVRNKGALYTFSTWPMSVPYCVPARNV